MSPEKLDKETQKVLDEGREVAEFVNSAAWQRVKKNLFDKLITLDSLTAIPTSLPNEAKLVELTARAGAVSIVIQWIQEVEGVAKQHQANSDAMMATLRRESIVQFFPDQRS